FHTWGRVSVDNSGQLVLTKADGSGAAVYASPPVIFQMNGANKTIVPGKYLDLGNGQVGFQITGSYNPSLPLIIDPTFAYSTFIGGNNDDSGNAVAADGIGEAYFTGTAKSANFPVQGNLVSPGSANQLAFVTKVNAGGQLLYSTFFGANGNGDNTGS